MKVWHGIYTEIITIDNIFQAWDEFLKSKRSKWDVMTFGRNLEDNLFELQQNLKGKKYKHGRYKSFFVRDPKVRHIHKAQVRDRVVHHLTSKVLEKIFEPTFYSHSYSCRKDKGTHKAVIAFIKMTRKISNNNTSGCFVLKCDVRKFFQTVDHRVLLRLLRVRIKDKNFLWLLKEIIKSFVGEFTFDAKNPKGMPIGNLTSQLFANIYLDPLDQFIKHKLKPPAYIRYADDFAVISSDEKYLKGIIPKIERFVSSKLKLALHPQKVSINDYYLGTDFLGYVIFPNFVLPRTKTKKRMFRKLCKKTRLIKSQDEPIEKLNEAIQSYLGYLSHASAFKLSENTKNQILFWLSS